MHLLDLFRAHPVLRDVAETFGREPANNAPVIQLTGVPSAAWGAVAADLQRRTGRTLLLIAPDGESAEHCVNDLRALFDIGSAEHGDIEYPEVLFFPIPER